MTDSIPILLDTDIASDIDDAVALAYLLRQPRCELVGITTVSGNVAERSACAEAVCREVGRTDVPIHSGASGPLLWGPGQPDVPQYEAVRDLAAAVKNRCTAIEFMRDTIRSRPGEITLLSIGPFTNLALLFAIDPEIPSMLKQLVSMAGVFFTDPLGSEWNCLVDPVATGMTYAAKAPGHLSVGLDVTTKCTMAVEEVRTRFMQKPLNLVLKMAEVWFKHTERITFHDPLAAATIFEPSLCTLKRGNIEVVVDPEPDKGGITRFTESADGPHTVASDVNVEGFFKEYFSVFAR